MRILMASSEAVPFSKTGGLGDVAGALAKALARLGHEVALVIPHYPRLLSTDAPTVEPIGKQVTVPLGMNRITADILSCQSLEPRLNVFLVHQPGFYDRDGIYRAKDAEYPDNCARFAFFGQAVLEVAQLVEFSPDVVHVNDWQTGLVPALLATEYRHLPEFSHTASVLTIHNMAFQGNFPAWDMPLTGLDWSHFNWQETEFYGQVSLLKTGIVFSDILTTVSPTYAQEIQTPESGWGMDSVLSSRADDLVGILNGIDTEVWNPATDAYIAQQYDVATVREGKAVCRSALRRRFGLADDERIPLFGMVSRITHQKGFDLIAQCADELCRMDLQLVFLGTGESKYEAMLRDLSQRFPHKVGVVIGFDDVLAHQIEAGADAYLMPSRFEPCGLNQMYSLRYGTVPVVHAVGGLADTVVDASCEDVEQGRANGFCFKEYSAAALTQHVRRAVLAYQYRDFWNRLVQNGMKQDWSWNRRASEYVAVYARALEKRG